MKISNKKLSLFAGFALLLSACDKADPVIPHEEELITTLRYTLIPENEEIPVILSFVDIDGDGGSEPIITTGKLQANTKYTGTILLLNELESPAHNVSEEVKEEGVDHQFFYSTTVDGLSITYEDSDENGHPVGLVTKLSTGAAGSGQLTIVLRHEPVKEADGVKEGDIVNAGGETDIEVTFDIDVQ